VNVTAGKTTVYTVSLVNNSSAPVTNIIFSSDKPSDWEIDFPQNGISFLAVGATENMDVKIIPPAGTIAGDYLITLSAKGNEITASDLQVRVTVEVPTIWGWVGVAIIVVVIIGLAYVFMRFSRR
jgi:uncharacterized membrane protein